MRSHFGTMLAILLCVPVLAHAQSLSDNTTLLGSFAPQAPTSYSDIWGYAAGGREYAIMGTLNGTSIVDVTGPEQPVEVAFIAGAQSPWRDIKTYSHYAYVVHDANQDQFARPGMQIIDLANLPAGATLVNTYRATLGPGTAHNLFIENHFAYLAGSQTAGGANILDLSDPVNPIEIGRWDANYWHDIVVKNDTIYASAGSLRAIEIVDGRDKRNLRLIARLPYPGQYTHNAWITDDNRYLSVTDESHGQPVYFWDVSDPANANLLATYTAAENAVAHNTHIHGNYAIISYYFDGLKIVDISQRAAPTEVGHYDTFPEDNFQRGSGFDGAWGAYPFLPSGNILVSDIDHGLFIIGFNQTRAGYITGVIRDSETQQPVPDVEITLLNPESGEGKTSITVGPNGVYTMGAKPGPRSFRFHKFGYQDAVVENVQILEGETAPRNVNMIRKPVAPIVVQARTTLDQPIPGGKIVVTTAGFRTESLTNQKGEAGFALPTGTYELRFVSWGYVPRQRALSVVNSDPVTIGIVTEPGYVETFTEAVNWELRSPSDDSAFDWFIGKAADAPFGSRLLDFDHTGDPGGHVIFSRARFGRSTLTSLPFDATQFNKPKLQFARFYNPYRWAQLQANDTLKVLLSKDDGASWQIIDSYTGIDRNWRVLTYAINTYLTPSASMRLRFVNIEGDDAGSFRGSSFAMLDDIRIGDEDILTGSETEAPLPRALELLQNYPNPFNPTTTICWRQAARGAVEIALYNTLGRRVATVRTGPLQAGEHTWQIELTGFPTGVYFYRLRMGNAASPVRKLLFLK